MEFMKGTHSEQGNSESRAVVVMVIIDLISDRREWSLHEFDNLWRGCCVASRLWLLAGMKSGAE